MNRRRAALAGLLGAGAALATTELLAGLVAGIPSLVVAVGAAVIDATPPRIAALAIAAFGTADKPVLLGSMALGAGALGAVVGILAARRRWVGPLGMACFGAAGAAAGARAPAGSAVSSILVAVVAVAVGSATLELLLRAAEGRVLPDRALPQPEAPEQKPPASVTRRSFLRLALGAGVLVVGAAGTGRVLAARAGRALEALGVTLPRPASPLPTPGPGTSLAVDGLSPLFVPNGSFYRIDTALSVPRVDLDTWRLKVTGLVERAVELTYDDLLAMDLREADITLSCVSNEVGGRLVGNARWTGVALSEVLGLGGVLPDATQIVGRAVDGWTAGFPTAVGLDGREALVVVGMNGEILPAEHGFPARLIVPGLYGYVSATKWLVELELTRWEDFDGYWISRGWAKEGPMKTQSRIDVPSMGTRIAAGRVPVAGIAWAGERGIDRVEVAIDGGDWAAARLSEALAPTAWRQWSYAWDAEPGRHTVSVRATDGTGSVQTAAVAPPRPDGATGHHTIDVTVDAA